MRIIAGQWRGRKLATPEGQATRPTADRVREALFSMLASRLGTFEDLRIADIYAGSGAVGLEALSRGAAFACFVDPDASACAAIRANVAALGASGRSQLLSRSAASIPPQRPFDVVFADPPYAAGSGTAALAGIVSGRWIGPGSWISIETERGDAVRPGDCSLEAERDIGRARITLLRA